VVIDWDSPTYGNPLSDVARTYLILSAGPRHVPARVRPLVSLVSRFICRNYLRAYRALAADLIEKAGDLNTWLWINAAARLVEGVAVEEQSLTEIVRRGAALAATQARGEGPVQ
jgi:aminoglycoside phosphotransferase (APT) family kinase protein